MYKTLLHLSKKNPRTLVRYGTNFVRGKQETAYRMKTSPNAPFDFPSWNSSVFCSCLGVQIEIVGRAVRERTKAINKYVNVWSTIA